MAWNNPYQPNYPGVGYNPQYNPMGQQPGYMNAPIQPQQPVQAAVTQPVVAIQGRMVTSKEEVVATPTDFSGTPLFFPDLGKNRIFMKKFDMNTGSSPIAEFRLYIDPQDAESAPQAETSPAPVVSYADVQDDIKALHNRIADLQDEVAELREEIIRNSAPVEPRTTKGGRGK